MKESLFKKKPIKVIYFKSLQRADHLQAIKKIRILGKIFLQKRALNLRKNKNHHGSTKKLITFNNRGRSINCKMRGEETMIAKKSQKLSMQSFKSKGQLEFVIKSLNQFLR